jgi:hypothetical protein
VLAIGQVRLEHALLDQDRAVRGCSLVVHRRCAPLSGVAPVVDDRDELARDLLPDAARVDGQALQIQVSFEAVTDGFVDERPTGLAREDHHVRAGRRGLRADVQHGATRRDPRGLRDDLVVEHLESARAADRFEPRFEHVALPGDDVEREVEPHAGVLPVRPVAVGDEHVLDALGVGHGHLADPRIEPAGDLVRRAQQRDLSLDGDAAWVDGDRVWPARIVRGERCRLVPHRAVLDARGGAAGKRHHVVDVSDIAVRVGGSFADDHTDSGALINSGDRILDPAVIEHELKRLVPFPEELSEIAASRERGAQRSLRITRGNNRCARDR